MNCGVVRKLTSAYVEGEVTADERRRIDGHLATCASCQASIHDVGRVMTAVQSLRPARVSRGFVDAVMDRIAEAGDAVPVRREWAWPSLPTIRIPGIVWGPALAAAAVALVVFVPRSPRTAPHEIVPAPALSASASRSTPQESPPTVAGNTQVASNGTSSPSVTPVTHRGKTRHAAPAPTDAGTAMANANPIMSTQAVGTGGMMLDGTHLDATPAEVYWILDEVSAENAGVLQRASTSAPTTRPAHKRSLTF